MEDEYLHQFSYNLATIVSVILVVHLRKGHNTSGKQMIDPAVQPSQMIHENCTYKIPGSGSYMLQKWIVVMTSQ